MSGLLEPGELLLFIETVATVCRTAVADNGPVMGALAIAGLVGGFTHCAGMCGPFVLAQTTARGTGPGGGELARLRGAALVPYHLGRGTTYAALGALAALFSGQLTALSGFRYLGAGLLLLAAILFLSQTLSGAKRLLPVSSEPGRLSTALSRWSRPFVSNPRGLRGYALGLILGFLPCGLLYGALAAAAAAESPLGGAFVMLAFSLGTVPALVGVGYLGQFFGRRWAGAMGVVTSVMALVSATILVGLAWRLVA